jgi:hypothetical protein
MAGGLPSEYRTPIVVSHNIPVIKTSIAILHSSVIHNNVLCKDKFMTECNISRKLLTLQFLFQ